MDNTMDTINKKMENLINECKRIEEDSMYNAGNSLSYRK